MARYWAAGKISRKDFQTKLTKDPVVLDDFKTQRDSLISSAIESGGTIRWPRNRTSSAAKSWFAVCFVNII